MTAGPTPAPAVKALTCPNCGAPVEIRAAGHSVTYVCGHCGSTLDATEPELILITAAHRALAQPRIAIGTRGHLRGEWEVVGYVERTGGQASWSEYLLFNPYLGYRFLVDSGDGWSFGTLLDRLPEPGGDDQMVFDRASYERSSDEGYTARVTFVVGEFYWRVAVGETVRVTEFSRRRVTLSREENETERTWTRLDTLDDGEVEAAFGLPPREPDEEWDDNSYPGPSPYGGRLWSWGAIALFAIGFLFLATASAQGTQRVFGTQLSVMLDAPEKTVVLGQVHIDRTEPVTITGSADNLDNDWVDIDYSLVNRKTQESYDSYATVEHYHGTDSDGPWSEGKNVAGVKLSSVPPGDYDLVADISAHRWSPQGSYVDQTVQAPVELPLGVWVDRGGYFGGNVWTAVLLILSWPSVLGLLHYMHVQRQKLYR